MQEKKLKNITIVGILLTDIKNCIWKIYKEKIGITKNKYKEN